MRFAKTAIVVLDGVGVGEAPDAALFADEGSNTLGNTARAVGRLALPNLGALGLGNILDLPGVPAVESPRASWGRMRPAAPGKDTTTGHWELAGVVLAEPFPVYPGGFPPQIMAEFARIAGAPALGNVAASGTEIIERLGAEHRLTGRPIVYTSADSVFQIAAHEETIPVEELYRICRETRRLLTGAHAVGRVIARPFAGSPGGYRRTERRRDFSLEPPRDTLLDLVQRSGRAVVSVGKIDDIFAGRGITTRNHVLPTADCIAATAAALREIPSGLVFTNLIAFDMEFGHRNNVEGMAQELERTDGLLPELLAAAGPDTLLLFTADHGNDPTTPSTDHSREEVPLLAWSGGEGVPLNVRASFADVAATVAENFGLGALDAGDSFLSDLPGGSEKERLAT